MEEARHGVRKREMRRCVRYCQGAWCTGLSTQQAIDAAARSEAQMQKWLANEQGQLTVER